MQNDGVNHHTVKNMKIIENLQNLSKTRLKPCGTILYCSVMVKIVNVLKIKQLVNLFIIYL